MADPKTTEPEIVIDSLGGKCPVQAEGTINGVPFYFRARGEIWTLEVGADLIEAVDWEHAEWFGEWPDAGWMTDAQAETFLRAAAARYSAGLPGAKLSDDAERTAAHARRMREKFGI